MARCSQYGVGASILVQSDKVERCAEPYVMTGRSIDLFGISLGAGTVLSRNVVA